MSKRIAAWVVLSILALGLVGTGVILTGTTATADCCHTKPKTSPPA